MRFLINTCWFAFRWGLAVVMVTAIAAGGYLYLQLDDEIRRFAHAMLAEHYPQHEISIGSARFVPARGVSLFDVRLARRVAGAPPVPQLEISELRLVGDFDLKSLATGDQTVRRIEVRQPQLHAVRNADGQWECASLWPPPKGDGPAPPVTITNATVTLRDATASNAARSFAISNIDLTLEGAPQPAGGKPVIKARGSISGSIARSLRFEGSLGPDGAISCRAEADGLHVTDDLITTLPGVDAGPQAGLLRKVIEGLRVDLRLAGRASVQRVAEQAPFTWDADFRVVSGGVDHPRLPRPISDLTLTAHADQGELQIAKLNARLGEAELSAAGGRRGWAPDSTATATWRLAGLTLDEKLYATLPTSLKMLWNRFRPSGVVDATGSAEFDGTRLKPDATLTCRGVSFEDHEQFPYRLTDATGAIRFVDRGPMPGQGRLDVNLIAQGEGRPIRVSAEFGGLPCVTDPHAVIPSCPLGWIEIRGDTLRVTDALLGALPEAAQEVTKALDPRGEFSAYWRAEKLTVAELKPTTKTLITAKDGSLRFKHFPYPLRHIAGELHEQNGRWWFENVTAHGASGQLVSASGALDPPALGSQTPHTFRMRIGGEGVPLDDALHGALPSPAQHAWDELRPRGRIDFSADVFCQIPAEPRIDLVMAPHKRDLAIEPRSFPYRMEQIDGRFVFSENRLAFQSARAKHGQTEIEAGGLWSPSPGGGWRLELNSLAVDRLDADHDFRLAAPLGLRRFLSRVDPQGRFGVHNGRLVLTMPPGRDATVNAAWDMEFDFLQADLSGGLQIEDATGSLRLAGQSDGNKTVTIGELDVDTLFWNGLQVTGVRGPLWCDEQQCLLGVAVANQQTPGAPQGQAPPARPITLDAYGGVASLNAQVIFDVQPRYGAAVSFRGVDLERFTSEYGRAQTPLAGTADGSLELRGLGVTVYGLGGTGELHVRDADFGELPVLVALFKTLRGRAPDKTAFDRCDARFRLQGEHISFDQLNLFGDAISLNGRGGARLDRSLELTFHSILARNDVDAPLLRALVGQASEQLLTIHVDGSIDEPEIRRETLPMVGNVLRQFQQNQTSQPNGAPQTPPARRY